MNGKMMYGWEYPPREPISYQQEKIEREDDARVLSQWPDEIAWHILEYIDNPHFKDSCIRIAHKINTLVSPEARDKFITAVNDGAVAVGYPPIIFWQDEQ
jgi:hypothetical protein